MNQNIDFLEAGEENPSGVREQVIVSDARERVSKAKAEYGWCGSKSLAAVDLSQPVCGSTLLNSVLKMNPVVSQPGYGSAISGSSDWQTGTFDCFDDIGICLCGAFFPLCLSCQIASDMNEFCLCGSSVAMRTMYRTRYGIPGSICKDFLCLVKFTCHKTQLLRTYFLTITPA
ncbi:hypothetical protein R6Z07M_007794 [Ovis aries]